MIYDRLHTRDIARYGGLAVNMPKYALFFMVFTMASVGLPGTSGFVGEFLVMLGAYAAETWIAFAICTGIILGAAYMLYLYRRVVFGVLDKADVRTLRDLEPRELAILGSLAAVVLWMGVYPASFLRPLHAPVQALLARVDRARPPASQHVVPLHTEAR